MVRGFRTALAVSAAIHAAGALVLAWRASPPAMPPLTPRDISFYLLHFLDRGEADAPGADRPPVPRPEDPPSPPSPRFADAEEAIREAEAAGERVRAAQARVEEMEREIARAPRELPPPSRAGRVEEAEEAEAGWAGLRYVYDVVKPRVRERLAVPAGAGTGTAVVQVRIGRDGEILELRVRESSGVEALDEAARAAVEAAAPFPPLRDHLDAPSILVNCRFRFGPGAGELH